MERKVDGEIVDPLTRLTAPLLHSFSSVSFKLKEQQMYKITLIFFTTTTYLAGDA